jgi:hypothetical protein
MLQAICRRCMVVQVTRYHSPPYADTFGRPETKLTPFSLRTFMFGITVLSLGACASTPSNRVTESSQDVITSVEINATPVATAYDLVNRLRPAWLRAGRTGSIGGGTISSQVTLVYLDGTRLGGIESLRTLSAAGIRSMKYLDATRAATVLRDPGSEAIAGAIVISTR